MPLVQSKSKNAFKKNIETEMKAGKPQNQSLAIAYGVKRKNAKKKMATGGAVDSTPKTPIAPDETAKQSDMSHAEMADYHAKLSEHYQMLADGGQVDLEENSEESPNVEDQLSFEANGKEQYDDEQISKQPEGSNEHGDEIESDKHDRIARMREKIKAKRGM